MGSEQATGVKEQNDGQSEKAGRGAGEGEKESSETKKSFERDGSREISKRVHESGARKKRTRVAKKEIE